MPTDYFELGPWALGAMLKLLLLVSAFSACVATDVIIQTGTAYQEGKFPYIADGLKVSSVEECKQKCLDSPDCRFGTYVTAYKDTPEGYNYQEMRTAGRCWLAAKPHAKPTPCGTPPGT